MIEFQILSNKLAGVSKAARHFPVRIGRSPENDLQLEEAGVWDRHFSVEFNPATGFTLQAEPDALVTVNHLPVRSCVLRVGDSIEFGAARLRFWIAPPARRGLRWRGLAVWALIVAVLATEVWILCWLLV